LIPINVTSFPIYVFGKDGVRYKLESLLDTGAPSTEFSDEALQHIGFMDKPMQDVQLKRGLQTQKYDRVTLPKIEICSQAIEKLSVYVSHFDKSWGIKALVGLDFFRRFDVRINYKLRQIITEPL
jgi:predicted aspartyl protease